MSQQLINVGSLANDGTGDTLRNSQIKSNANFTELYNIKVPQSRTITIGGVTLDLSENRTFPSGGGGDVDTSPKKTSTLYVNGGLNGVVSTSNSFSLFWGGNPDGGYFENGNSYLNGMETTLMKSSSSAVGSYTSLVWWNPVSLLRTKSKLVGFLAIGSNALIPDSRTFAGYFQYGYSMNNINYSIASVAGFLNDTEDANLQFCRLTSGGVRVKTDLGSDFPARYTAGQHEYKFLIEIISSTSVSFKIKNLITGATSTGTFTDCNIGSLPMISMAMNNNTTNLQTNLKFTSLIYAENYEF